MYECPPRLAGVLQNAFVEHSINEPLFIFCHTNLFVGIYFWPRDGAFTAGIHLGPRRDCGGKVVRTCLALWFVFSEIFIFSISLRGPLTRMFLSRRVDLVGIFWAHAVACIGCSGNWGRPEDRFSSGSGCKRAPGQA